MGWRRNQLPTTCRHTEFVPPVQRKGRKVCKAGRTVAPQPRPREERGRRASQVVGGSGESSSLSVLLIVREALVLPVHACCMPLSHLRRCSRVPWQASLLTSHPSPRPPLPAPPSEQVGRSLCLIFSACPGERSPPASSRVWKTGGERQRGWRGR